MATLTDEHIASVSLTDADRDPDAFAQKLGSSFDSLSKQFGGQVEVTPDRRYVFVHDEASEVDADRANRTICSVYELPSGRLWARSALTAGRGSARGPVTNAERDSHLVG